MFTRCTPCMQVSTLESSVQQISEQLEALKSQSDERGESMTDTGPLVRLKSAMKKMKTEIKEMDLRLGTVSHNLLHIKMAQSTGEHCLCVCAPTPSFQEAKLPQLDTEMGGGLA